MAVPRTAPPWVRWDGRDRRFASVGEGSVTVGACSQPPPFPPIAMIVLGLCCLLSHTSSRRQIGVEGVRQTHGNLSTFQALRPMTTAIFTIVAKNYLAHARVLMESIRRQHPDLLRIVVLVDEVDGYFDPTKEPFEVVLSSEFNLPSSRWFHFKYSILELSTAVKPYACEYLFQRYRLKKLIYLDPDIKTYARLDCLLNGLDHNSILITPHLTDSIEDNCQPGELDILRSGTYNLGFIGLALTEETQRFLTWWQSRLYEHCVVDLDRGLFVDQRWMDLAPSLFSGVSIDRRPGLNVAYWNLMHRVIRAEKGGRFTANGETLFFFHFSGFDPDNPMQFSKHQNRFRLSDLGDATYLVSEYKDALLKQGYAECRRWPYAYGRFRNGFPIPDLGRPLHHEHPEIVEQVADPFSDDGFRAFIEVWNGPLNGQNSDNTGLTRLAYRIYRTRPDVQAVMSDVAGADRIRFLEWFVSSGKREHRLNEAFLAPAWNALDAARPTLRDMVTTQDRGPMPAGEDRGSAEHNGSVPAQEEASLPDSVEASQGHQAVRLTRLARGIYESRADLKERFSSLEGEQGLGLLAWFLSYGRWEHNLGGQTVVALHEQWKAGVQALATPSGRLRQRTRLALMKGSVLIRASAARALLKFSRLRANWLMRRYELEAGSARKEPDDRRSGARTRLALPAAAGSSLNLIGYVRSEMGVGESARLAVAAARRAGISVRLRSVDGEGPYRKMDHRAGEVSSDFNGHFNLFHVNADQTPLIFSRLERQFHSRKFNIGYWAWELSEFPDRWRSSYGYYDEIWTPSSFCQSALAPASPVPVICIPHAVEVTGIAPLGRSDFGLKPEEFVFLCIFDMLSVFERKNPLAVVEAFRRTFQGHPDCRLVIKVNHGDERPKALQQLAELCRGHSITIINRTIAREELNALIRLSDCVVSLHRAEGFGLTLAEAMYLGKPVIATAYSGNMDFTNPSNSFLVGYQLRPVGPGCEPYDSEQLWAHPDITSACEQMRSVYECRDLRERRAAAGQEHVRRFLSPEAVGEQIRRRLDLIARAHANQQ